MAIAAGVLMIQYREKMVEWLTIAIGALFFLSGVISIINYCVVRSRQTEVKPMFPIVGIGCALLGIILALLPGTVTDYLVYVLAIILILGAVGEYVSLLSAIYNVREFEKASGEKSSSHLGYHFWILPTILLLFGILALLYPESIKSAPLLFLGIAMVIYGISELINAIKLYSMRKYIRRNQIVDLVRNDNDITDAEIVEESEAPADEQ